MTVKNPKNGLTLSYLAGKLRDNDCDAITVGNETFAYFVSFHLGPKNPTPVFDAGDEDNFSVALFYNDQTVVTLLDDDTVQLERTDRTAAFARRMDWALLPLGFRLITNNAGHGHLRWGRNASAFKVYSIATGAYRDYTPGMIVERGAF